MKLWLISQDVNNGWDTYDSAVVAAPDEDSAFIPFEHVRNNFNHLRQVTDNARILPIVGAG